MAAHFFTTRQMTLSESRVGNALFHLFTPRKSGPDGELCRLNPGEHGFDGAGEGALAVRNPDLPAGARLIRL